MESQNSFQELKNKSSKGIKWVGIAEIFIRVFQYGTTIILAWLLTPRDFGLIGIAFIFTQLAYVLFDFGFSSALIQRKDISKVHYSTTFVLYLLSAVLYSIIVFSLAPFLAMFFDNQILSSLLRVLTIIFFFYAFNAMPRIQLQRNMQFKKLTSMQMVSVLCYSIVTILSALNGAGVWSFVYGIIAEQFVLTILLNFLSWWKFSFRFDRNAFNDLIKFGSSVLGTRIVGYLNANAPNFIIGKLLGVTALGYYNVAYQLVEFPVQRISKNVLRVMFPVFSKLQEDQEDYVDLYKTVVYYLSLVLMPIFAGLILIAPYVIEILYGEKWIPAVLPLQLLAAAGFFRSLWVTTSLIFLSKGSPQTEFKINIIFSIFLVPLLIYAAGYGLNFVAATVSLTILFFLVIAQKKALELINMSIFTLLRVYLLPAFAVLVFTSLVVLLNYFIFPDLTMSTKLLFTILISASVYVLIIIKFEKDIISKMIGFFRAK